MVVPTLQRAVIGKPSKMPLAEERGAVAGFLEERRQRRMRRRQTDGAVISNRLFQADTQAVLITSGDQRRARRGAHRGVGVRLLELQPLRRETIDIRSFVIAA